MKRSARAISLILVLAMAFSLALTACGGADPSTPGNSGSTVPSSTRYQPPGEEYKEPLVDGYNQVTFYWNHPDADYETCDIWIWWGDVAGKGYTFHECSYGGKVIVNVPDGVAEVGFIVRRDCSEPGGSSWGSATKDYEQDRFAVVDGRETVIYLKPGDANQYQSNDGGKTLDMIKKFSLANMTDLHKIQYRITPKTLLSSLDQVKVYEGDKQLTVSNISTMGRQAATGVITVEEELDLTKNYRVEIEGFGSKAVLPIGIFDSAYFAENFHYDGDDLGAVINGENTTFKVWAPTASKVVLNLFEAGSG